ncbi:hypothetical protein SAY87_019944 [Trapa incisa]|uniref:dolichyl-P-Man:Man5GlcNAc2-PP-dolichol alpha-1,3-mannosyltransferase n=1 Tax=Trapa incisa TaxID=236973 RepID=A0AAN7Q3G8_9MYRT|nr:hypothetical protein SAY87_019944 [Trapa incisa]
MESSPPPKLEGRRRSKTSSSDCAAGVLWFKSPKVAFALALLASDAVLVSLIIAYVPYTKIDWDAYMSQVSGFLGGERDYGNLKGDIGPLVYPAGFLYVYSFLQHVTGGEVYRARILFGILYIINLGIVFFIHVKTDVLIFVSKGFALSLLVAHLMLLTTFAHYRWCKHEGGLLRYLYLIQSNYIYVLNISLWAQAPPEYPYADDKSSVRDKDE